jgi:hypothetical protein
MTTATNDPTDTVYDHVREVPDVLAELRTAHLNAAAVAAELDLDHGSRIASPSGGKRSNLPFTAPKEPRGCRNMELRGVTL